MMKRLEPFVGQDYIMPDDKGVVILDSLGQLPENEPYYSEYIFIAICTEGKAQIVYDGNPIVLHKDEVFAAVPGSVLSDYLLSPSFDCKILIIKPDEVTATEDLHNRFVKSSFYFKKNPVAQMTEMEKEILFGYYNLIIQRIQNPDQMFFKGILHSLLSAFLMEVVGILMHGAEETEPTTVHGEQIVKLFVQMVNESNGRERRVDYYAEKLNITPKYLSTLVSTVLRRTPTDIIRITTMREIERLLHYSDNSIKQISNIMNFPNTSFFGKYFKKNSGMTPMAFRIKNRGKVKDEKLKVKSKK